MSKRYSNSKMKKILTLLLLLLSVCGYSQEGDTVATPVTSEAIASDSSSTTEKTNIIDRVMQHFEYRRGRFSSKLYPSLGFDPASGLSIGALSLVIIEPNNKGNKKIRFYRPTSISSLASYSTNKWLNLKSDMVIYATHGVMVNANLQYQISPDKFYGIGNDTLNTNPVKFDMRDFQFMGNVSKELTPTCFLGFMFDISNRKCKSLGANEDGFDIPELKNPVLFGLGPHFTFDRRDNVNYPTHGELITVGFKYFAPYNENAYSFHAAEINMRKYMRLYKDLILATQVFWGTSDGDIPFYSMYQLGGMTRMRGISNKYIYIDKNAYYAQAELRKHIWSRFSAVIFGGIGDTYSSASDYNMKHIKYVYGAGIRFQSDVKNNINLRVDYGRGSFGDSGVYMTMREAF